MPDFLNDAMGRVVTETLSGLRGFGLGLAVAIPLNTATPAQAGEQIPLPADDRELMFAVTKMHIEKVSDSLDMLEFFLSWHDYLEQVALNDPEEAVRQRLPVAACLATILAEICYDMPGLFAPEPEPDRGPLTQ